MSTFWPTRESAVAAAGSAAMISRALASAASLLGTAPAVASVPFTAEGAAEMDTEASASPFLSVPTASARTTWRPRLAGKTTAEVLEDALRP